MTKTYDVVYKLKYNHMTFRCVLYTVVFVSKPAWSIPVYLIMAVRHLVVNVV